LCQAARAQIAARQQHLHLRGLGADDICVFIVVAVACLLFHAGALARIIGPAGRVAAAA